MGVRGLFMTSQRYPEDDPVYGSLALSTTWPDTFAQSHWLRAGWFDAMHDFWDHFAAEGALPPREYGPSEEGKSDVGTLGLTATRAAGRDGDVALLHHLVLPQLYQVLARRRAQLLLRRAGHVEELLRLAVVDAWDVAAYYARNEERLYRETRLFHDTLFASKLPPYVLDAALQPGVHPAQPHRVAAGGRHLLRFRGLPLGQRLLRRLAAPTCGTMPRPRLSSSPHWSAPCARPTIPTTCAKMAACAFACSCRWAARCSDFHAAADGQLGGIMKVYRDWRLCGDDAWLRSLWPKVKKALEYAWEQWDPDRDGVIEGIQHNTYDIEFLGPNSMIGSFYLGALRAAEEMARHLGEDEDAQTYRRVYESGRARMERELFNGEFYVQKYDPASAPKYQYGEGCLSDQMIGQWFAQIVGLGYLFEPEHVRRAMRSIFDYNWRTDFWEHPNPQRIYALNDEKGLLLCSWPRGGRPELPFVYSDEVWCGIEYQVASHLIYEGLVDEGLAIVKGVRERHDGRRRNPWNEFECGSHYARSMASWAVLTALSGYYFDLPNKTLGFRPRLGAEDWQAFWSTDQGWGLYSQSLNDGQGEVTLSVAYGSLALQHLVLGSIGRQLAVQATVDDQPVTVETSLQDDALRLSFSQPVALAPGRTLRVALGRAALDRR